ncbi:hypothetical protein [uncultured Thiothrix sp.]|uniref:hypothetical protein n=1 Tax=uncultured Thiothrix sp. TaxID=223185 RepID=UPI0026307583|nr:hypothetical protein [uncultured Thiothrix sp.]
MKLFSKKLLGITLGVILFNTACTHAIGLSQIENTFDIARANAEKKLATHHGVIPNGAYIARGETFYDTNNQPMLYEFVLMKGTEDVGSFFGNVKTGEVDGGGSLYKSMSYDMDKYYHDLLEPTFQAVNLKVIEKRRINLGIDGNLWRVKFAQPPSTPPMIEFITGCSTAKENGWYEFKRGTGAAICEQPFQM